jgi:N-acetyltransferase 10
MVRCSLHKNFTLRADVRRSVIELTSTELSFMMSPFDLKRLDSYANNMLDYHVILDLLPTVALLYFEKRLGEEVKMSAVQSAILLALGLQRKTIEDVEVGSVY